MKTWLFGTSAIILVTLFTACKKNDFPPFVKENCQVIGDDVSNEAEGETAHSRIYTYDKNGYVSRSSTKVTFTQEGIGEIKFTYIHDYTRDKNGKTISIKIIYSDNQGNRFESAIDVIYDNKGKKIEHLIEYSDNEPFIDHTIKYNERGLVSEYTSQYLSRELSDYNQKRFLEYNSIGQFTKKTLTDADENPTKYSIYEPKGKTSSNEAYLIDHGLLPVDLIFNNVFSMVDGGAGSVENRYVMIHENRNTIRNSRFSPVNIIMKRSTKLWSMKLSAITRNSLQQIGMYKVLVEKITTKSVALNQRGFPKSRLYEVVAVNDGSSNEITENYQFECSGNGRQ